MFRFTIRDVLWLMVVVAMALAWWLEHRSTSTTLTRLRYIATKLTLPPPLQHARQLLAPWLARFLGWVQVQQTARFLICALCKAAHRSHARANHVDIAALLRGAKTFCA